MQDRKPSLERLEHRITPATTSFLNGNLLVTGDANTANLVRFDPGPNPGDVTVTVNNRVNTFSGVTQLTTICGDRGDDVANNTNINSIVMGGKGNDSFIGGNGNDALFGGNGKDVLYDLVGINQIFAQGGGADRVYGNAQSQAFVDKNDQNAIFFAAGRGPGAGAISLELGVLYIAPSNGGTSTVISQTGNSIIVSFNFGVGAQTTTFSAKQVQAIAYFGGNGNDTYVNTTSIEEAAYGAAGNDQITSGTGAFNLLKGGGGNDVVTARGKRADIQGNAGSDILISQAPFTTVRADNNDLVFTTGQVRNN